MWLLLDDLDLMSARKYRDRSCAWHRTQGSRYAFFFHVISPFHSFIHPRHPYPSMGMSISFHWEKEELRQCVEFMSFLVFHSFLSRFVTYRLFSFQNSFWLVGRRPFMFSFIHCVLLTPFPSFVFVLLICLGFSTLYFLSACVVAIGSGGAFIQLVLSFVLAFVSVGVSASGGKAKEKELH